MDDSWMVWVREPQSGEVSICDCLRGGVVLLPQFLFLEKSDPVMSVDPFLILGIG